jgi:hypothetical protein
VTLSAAAAAVTAGQTVRFRPRGNSMAPRIRHRQLVTVAPADPAALQPGDVALARIRGSLVLHLVSAVDSRRERVQISNIRGVVNGWAPYRHVYGVLVAVED